MRVYANVAPPSFHVYHHNGISEVRLRENISMINDGLYVYDEYIIKNVPDYEGLEEDIHTRFEEWLATGRSLERVPNSSEIHHMEQEHMNELADLVEIVYQDDLGVIG